METKKLISVVFARIYLIVVGAYIIFENISLASLAPASILAITYLQAVLLIGAGAFCLNWIRIAAVCWSAVCLAISLLVIFLAGYSLRSITFQLIYYAVPLVLLTRHKVKEQFH